MLDANVLYPFGVRDVLLRFAESGLYRARWTEEILNEMAANLSKNISADKTKKITDMMNQAFPEALIEGYEDLITGLTLPDPKDRHVLAAAIRAGAHCIVTNNMRHFPENYVNQFAIEMLDADQFLLNTFELYPTQAVSSIRAMRADYKSPPFTASDLLFSMQRNGLAKLAVHLKPHIDVI